MAETGSIRNGSRPRLLELAPQIGALGSVRLRLCLAFMGLSMWLGMPSCWGARLHVGPQQEPAPIERRPPSGLGAPGNRLQGNRAPGFGPGNMSGGQRRGFPGTRGEHLTDWMSQHSNLSLQQQEQALGQEPGFRDLPAETQQRYRNRLAQLDAMNPQKRQRLLARNEMMERLTPMQRAQVSGALGQLGGLPPDQRRAVAQTFRALRELPPDQRLAALNSGRMGPPLNPGQRVVLDNLLIVAPMLPFPNRTVAPTPQPAEPPMNPPYPR